MVISYPTTWVPYAFTRMGFDPRDLNATPGLLFWKLGGTGHGPGFSARPNFHRYALFATWDSEASWESFLNHSPVVKRFHKRAHEIWWIVLLPVRSHGFWNRRALFSCRDAPSSGSPMAVLTRATIRFSRLLHFWSEVQPVSAVLERTRGLICSIGFGEIPWIRQATFSVWESSRAFEEFAYTSEQHRRAIQRTRDENWYAEELFARFHPIRSHGIWNGRDPLEGHTLISTNVLP